jgi:hypothetical protein
MGYVRRNSVVPCEKPQALFTLLDRVASGRIKNLVGNQSTNSRLIRRRSNPLLSLSPKN